MTENFESNLIAIDDRELDTVSGGFWQDGGCCPSITYNHGHIIFTQGGTPINWDNPGHGR